MSGDTFEVGLTVVGVHTDLGLVFAESVDGKTYGLNAKTPGIDFSELRVGQRVACVVTGTFNRVLQAQLVRTQP
jgi:hypothetical protein